MYNDGLVHALRQLGIILEQVLAHLRGIFGLIQIRQRAKMWLKRRFIIFVGDIYYLPEV